MMKSVTRLYNSFQPEHYDLTLVPDRDTMTFKGTVTVRGKKTGRPAERIAFHQKGLKVTAATIVKHDKKGDQELPLKRINNQDSSNEVRLHAEGMVYPGDYTVTMEFEGDITRNMNGIYPCFFKHAGQEKMLIATQFESHHAREAFPCIDEPEAKAAFDLTLTTPAGETVIANTPVASQKESGDKLVTSFETTPRMSTYLLAFAFGELGFKESSTKNGVTVRTYATPDNVPLTEHGLQVAVRCLEFFEEYFGLPYPLKKLDMVALPDFSSGAMENWGLVTYRETAMLADEKASSIETKQLVALVICHELSHQWFGNLVTMKWWDDLWLNESFANLMEYRAVEALYPEWHIWEQFVAGETAAARRRDSLADVQPIRTQVHHPDEISTLFDPSIVYAKGGSVLHMLLNYIGEDAFRKGLSAYFAKHKYGNTEAKDLWEALAEASGRDITDFMGGWLNRPGYPLVEVDWQPGRKDMALAQHRFLSDPAAESPSDEPWQVPLAATFELSSPLLDKAEQALGVTDSAELPLLLNHEGHSYFLPKYANDEHRAAIAGALKGGKVSAVDRLLLIDNYNLLQRGGEAETVELLELAAAFENESNENVWGALAMALGEVRKLVESDELSEDKLDALIARLAVPLAGKLGWDDAADDSPQTLRLRGLAISLAAGAKVQAALDEGLKRFRALTKPEDIDASVRGTAYYIAARYGTEDDFQKLLKLHDEITNADERDELAGGLTAAKEPKRYGHLIERLAGDTIRRQDLMHWFVWLLRNRYARTSAWQWLVNHWDWIEKEFSSDKSYGFFARYSGSIFSRPAELKQYQEFFDPKSDVVALKREIMLGTQEIKSRIAWRERNEQAVKDWLQHYR